MLQICMQQQDKIKNDLLSRICQLQIDAKTVYHPALGGRVNWCSEEQLPEHAKVYSYYERVIAPQIQEQELAKGTAKNKDQFDDANEQNHLENDVALMAQDNTMQNEMSKSIWMADSGASSHMGNDDTCMSNVKMINQQVKIGDATHLIATKIGTKHITFF